MTAGEHLPPALFAPVAERFRALGEPARLALLDALRDGPLSVTELVAATGQTQANASRHLGVLHSAGLVSRRRDGAYVYYDVADPEVWQLCELICGRLKRDAKAVLTEGG